MSDCPHEYYEREASVADGLCPICMHAEIERLRTENDKLRAEADHAIRMADLWKDRARRALEGK